MAHSRVGVRLDGHRAVQRGQRHRRRKHGRVVRFQREARKAIHLGRSEPGVGLPAAGHRRGIFHSHLGDPLRRERPAPPRSIGRGKTHWRGQIVVLIRGHRHPALGVCEDRHLADARLDAQPQPGPVQSMGLIDQGGSHRLLASSLGPASARCRNGVGVYRVDFGLLPGRAFGQCVNRCALCAAGHHRDHSEWGKYGAFPGGRRSHWSLDPLGHPAEHWWLSLGHGAPVDRSAAEKTQPTGGPFQLCRGIGSVRWIAIRIGGSAPAPPERPNPRAVRHRCGESRCRLQHPSRQSGHQFGWAHGKRLFERPHDRLWICPRTRDRFHLLHHRRGMGIDGHVSHVVVVHAPVAAHLGTG